MQKEKTDISDKILDAYYGSMGRDFMSTTRKRIHWIVESSIGADILDAGCSQGIVPLLLGREGKNVIGIDVDKEAISVANSQLEKESNLTQERITFINSDFNTLNFKKDKFDTIIISEVLEHLLNPRSFIDKSATLLNEKGLLIVTVPFGINDFSDHKKTYYFKEIYELISEYFTVDSFKVINKWIGFTARHKDFLVDKPTKINNRILAKLEESFYDIERNLVNKSYESQEKIQTLYKSVDSFRDKNERLSENLNKKTEESEYLRVENNKTKELLNSKSSELLDFQKTYEKLVDKFCDTADKLLVSQGIEKDLELELETNRGIFDTERTNTIKVTKKLQKDVEVSEANSISLRDELSNKEEEVSRVSYNNEGLLDKVASLQKDVEVSEANSISLRDELLNKEDEVSRVSYNNEGLLDKVASLQKDVEVSEANSISLRDELSNKEDEVSRVSYNNEGLLDKVASLQKDVEVSEANSISLRDELSNKEDEVSRVSYNNEGLLDKVASLQKDVEVSEANSISLRDELSNKEDEVSRVSYNNEGLLDKVASLQKDVEVSEANSGVFKDKYKSFSGALDRQKKLTKEYQDRIKTLNDRIKVLDRQKKALTETLSFRIGGVFVNMFRPWTNILKLPIDLVREYIRFKSKKKNTKGNGVAADSCHNIQHSPLNINFRCEPFKRKNISGAIHVNQSGERNAALISFNFIGSGVEGKSASDLGISYSKNVGFYKYIETEKNGNWNISIKIPGDCYSVDAIIQKWQTKNDIQICSVVVDDDENIVEDINKHLRNKGENRTFKDIDSSKLADNKKADFYEYLAENSKTLKKEFFYKESYFKDPSYLRAIRFLRKVVDSGYLTLANEILDDFESKKHKIKPNHIRNVNYAKGYVALYNSKPKIPPRKAPTSELLSDGNVMMFLHASLPHTSNGYATRSHAILTTMNAKSKYHIKPITRAGYPLDMGISNFEYKEVIDGVEYERILDANYYDQPLNEYMCTAASVIDKKVIAENPSIIHSASAFYTAIPALIAARKNGIPFVYEVRGLWEVTRASTIPNWGESERFHLERELETMVAIEADQVVAITEALKSELIKRGVEGSKITVIPNAVNKEHFYPMEENKALKKKIGLKDVPTIGYIGSVVDYEGIDTLLDALAILRKKQIKFNFLLVGDGNAMAGLKDKTKELNLDDSVFIIGRIPHEEVNDYYSLVDITPFPRKPIDVCEMVSPLKPFEAMALSKAVISSDVDALKEIVIDNETGLLFKKGNTEDLAEKIEKLLIDDVLRDRLAKKSREWVLENRDWAKVGSSFNIVYDNAKNRFANPEEWVESKPLSLMVYGDLNLNYIDGSAVWASSVVEILSGFKNTNITFLLKADLTHDTLIKSIDGLNNVTIISPSETYKGTKILAPEDAIEIIENLHDQNNYDAIIIRGFELNKMASRVDSFSGILCPYLIDVFHIKSKWDAEIIGDLNKIVDNSFRVFCQTTYIENFLVEKIPNAMGKTCLLPPMVPDQKEPVRKINQGGKFRIVYAGKFAPLWGTLEMISAFKDLRAGNINIELHIYGDKIHNPQEDKSFRPTVEDAFNNTDGVFWHKAKPRSEVIEDLGKYDLAWAWRRPELEENTDEISTKFLEYSSVGIPMVTVKNKITTKMLGEAYPIFVNDYEDLVPKLQQVVANKEIITASSKIVYEASKNYHFSSIRNNHLFRLMDGLQNKKNPKSILFAGHDLKFINSIINEFEIDGYNILIDNWGGHDQHNEEKSKALLSDADIIFCEWALGNAVWYSKNKLPNQKLFIRFHRQEIETKYPGMIKYDAVDNMAFIAPHVMRKTEEKFKLDEWRDKFIYIPNYVESNKLDIVKVDKFEFNLGMVGIVPMMKRLDRALDMLEMLREDDSRYQLFIKGKMPSDYGWMKSRKDEMKYYDRQMDRINNSEFLAGAVHFDGFGENMAEWYSKIGFILSTSDFEGSHLSIAEAMASGSTPIIIKWDGADEIYPRENCFNISEKAVEYILKSNGSEYIEKNLSKNKDFVKDFDIDKIYKTWVSVAL